MRQAFASIVTAAIVGMAQVPASAQVARGSAAIAAADVMSQISMFNYREGPKSELDFRGTPIAPNADGEADVEYKNRNARISVEVDDLPPPRTLGPYTTYILWALSPDGRAVNQGVVAGSEGGDGKLTSTYPAPQFALIVTAEPHFAVSAPSAMVVLYNVADDVKGTESKVTTLAERADYSGLQPIDGDGSDTALLQARYAIEIARASGAAEYAPDALAGAESRLRAAESALSGSRAERKEAPGLAREAVVAAEDARRASLVAARDAAAAAERDAAVAAVAAVERERSAQAQAEAAAAARREELVSRLNAALPTRQTTRGPVSEIGGVQFATGAAALTPGARESLARFAGIVASYPGLRFEIEGHTDDTGSPETNRRLSLERAMAVRDYLISQGVTASAIDVAGLGPDAPIADNATAEGRARNRRVEIVLEEPEAVAAR